MIKRMGMVRRVPAILAGVVLIATSHVAATAGARRIVFADRAASATVLTLRAVIPLRSVPSACPVGTPPEADECFARTGSALVSGLGRVFESYTFSVDQDAPGCLDGDILLAGSGQLTVAGKGVISVALAAGSDCFRPPAAVLQASRPFTIAGGTGIYADASGFGTLNHDVHAGPTGGTGNDTWSGSLSVPGLDFDVTAPKISGAVGRKVRAHHGMNRARVVYTVTARDDIDGVVRATCQPPSGRLFRVGRTRVSCSATDTSGNTAAETFWITVQPAP
jgi:hypothetical protein